MRYIRALKSNPYTIYSVSGQPTQIFVPKTAILAPILRPQFPPNQDQNSKKATSKKHMIFSYKFSWFGHGFEVVCLVIFHVKMSSQPETRLCKKAYETLPMATKSSFSVFKFINNKNKSMKKRDFFVTSIWKAFVSQFLDGFRRPKSMIFRLVSLFFGS